jgi:aldose 1-epimerase
MRTQRLGLVGGEAVEGVTLEAHGLRVVLMSLGATVFRLEAPDRGGRMENVTLGFRTPEEYMAPGPYFGSTVGRYANRIARGRFVLDGREHWLPPNEGTNCLHGGRLGFDKRLWRIVEAAPDRAVFERESPDGEEGFPGALRVRVTYALAAPATLRIAYEAETDAPTVVNLTNHSYWNLGGEGSGTALDHALEVAADAFLPVDAALLPTGELRPVADTAFDFRSSAPVGARIRAADPQLLIGRGYDHCFALRGGVAPEPRFAARLCDPASGRGLEVWTDQPGLQLYSGNFLDGSLVGPSSRAYRQGDGIALETQRFPDSPNRPDFPSTVLRPGEQFRSVTEWRFGVA